MCILGIVSNLRILAKLKTSIRDAYQEKPLTEQLSEAHEVVMGRHEEGWNPTQARVFAALLNKVMPDLTAQFVQHEHLLSDTPEKLSRAQLEEIAMGMNNILDAEVVEEGELDANSTGRSATPS